MGPRIAFCQGCSDWKAGGDVSGGDVRAGPAGVSCRGDEHPRGLARRCARCCRSRCRRDIAGARCGGVRSWMHSRGSSIGFLRTIGPATTSNGTRRSGSSTVSGTSTGSPAATPSRLFSNSGVGCQALRDVPAGFTVLSAVSSSRVTVRSNRAGPNWRREQTAAVAAGGADARYHLTGRPEVSTA